MASRMEPTFNEDFRDLLIASSDADARFMVVGGYVLEQLQLRLQRLRSKRR